MIDSPFVMCRKRSTRGGEQVANQQQENWNINYLALWRLLIRTISYIIEFVRFQFCPPGPHIVQASCKLSVFSDISRFDLRPFPHQTVGALPQHLQNLLSILTALHIDHQISSHLVETGRILSEGQKIHRANLPVLK